MSNVPINTKRSIMISSIGQFLEFYDLSLFSFLASVIAQQFFPATNAETLVILSLTTFTVGFISRPLGAIIFGYVGDRYGRKKSLSYSIIFMSLPTFLIGILPDYQTWGIASTVILGVLRFCQGLCVGGEFNGSSIYFLETYDGKYKGFYNSFICSSAVLGFFLASFLAFITVKYLPFENCWRICFLIGSSIGIFGYMVRKKFQETSAYLSIKSKNKMPIEVIYKYPLSSISTFLLAWGATTPPLTLVGYMTTHLNKFLKLELLLSMKINIFCILIFMLSVICGGWLCDKIKATRVMTLAFIFCIFIFIPIFVNLTPESSLCYLILSQVFLAIPAGLLVGSANIVTAKLFPAEYRYTGVCFNYSLGLSLVGGLSPVICGLLVTCYDSVKAPAFFIFFSSLVGCLSIYLIGRTKHYQIIGDGRI